jgi:hypothetical protein
MAEAVLVIGLISGIGSIASAAIKLSRMLRRIAKDIGSVEEEVVDFAKNVAIFSSVIWVANESLQHHCSQGGPTATISRIRNERIMEQLCDQSIAVNRRIGRVGHQLKGLKSRFDFISRLKWRSWKPEVRELSLKMESVKSSLNLLVCAIALEYASAHPNLRNDM